jgi:RNA polymerase sigma factor (sigma-70 family)
MSWLSNKAEEMSKMTAGDVAPSGGSHSSAARTDVLALYDEYAPELLSLALAATGSKDAAREALHEAFVALLGMIRSGEFIEEPREFLYQALRDAIALRGAQDAPPPSQPEATGAVEPDFDAPIRAAEVRRRLNRISSPRELEMIYMRTQGLSYFEIADRLQITAGTVASTLARAFRKIRKAFKEDFS